MYREKMMIRSGRVTRKKNRTTLPDSVIYEEGLQGTAYENPSKDFSPLTST
jgi:hypothetical protein